MTALLASLSDDQLNKLRQTIKWVVYSLLLINFGFYFYEDLTRAAHTLTSSSTFLDWTSAFAVSIDESAWFMLLFMFELETYVLGDDEWKGWVAVTVRGIRIFAFVLIAHTVYAYGMWVVDLQPSVLVEQPDLCAIAGTDISYVYNLTYTEIDAINCATLSTANEFYWVAKDPVVTDYAGLELERQLAWADVIEAVVWLVILLAIEVVVRLQNAGVTGGTLISTCNWSKRLLYLFLIGLGVWWATLDHWLYFWDELVWIGGFAAIEMNVSQWRNEIIEEQLGATT